MAQHGKKYRKALEGVDRTKRCGLEEAVALVKSLSYARYDEAVEISVRLGIDAKKTDQLVRGSVVLPHGLGKSVRVLVFAPRATRRSRRARRAPTSTAATSSSRR